MLPFDSKTFIDNNDILFRIINSIIKIESIFYCKNVICIVHLMLNVNN